MKSCSNYGSPSPIQPLLDPLSSMLESWTQLQILVTAQTSMFYQLKIPYTESLTFIIFLFCLGSPILDLDKPNSLELWYIHHALASYSPSSPYFTWWFSFCPSLAVQTSSPLFLSALALDHTQASWGSSICPPLWPSMSVIQLQGTWTISSRGHCVRL